MSSGHSGAALPLKYGLLTFPYRGILVYPGTSLAKQVLIPAYLPALIAGDWAVLDVHPCACISSNGVSPLCSQHNSSSVAPLYQGDLNLVFILMTFWSRNKSRCRSLRKGNLISASIIIRENDI